MNTHKQHARLQKPLKTKSKKKMGICPSSYRLSFQAVSRDRLRIKSNSSTDIQFNFALNLVNDFC